MRSGRNHEAIKRRRKQEPVKIGLTNDDSLDLDLETARRACLRSENKKVQAAVSASQVIGFLMSREGVEAHRDHVAWRTS